MIRKIKQLTHDQFSIYPILVNVLKFSSAFNSQRVPSYQSISGTIELIYIIRGNVIQQTTGVAVVISLVPFLVDVPSSPSFSLKSTTITDKKIHLNYHEDWEGCKSNILFHITVALVSFLGIRHSIILFGIYVRPCVNPNIIIQLSFNLFETKPIII